jgi:chromosome segregation ATPase
MQGQPPTQELKMPDTTQEILSLNRRVNQARERTIRLQSRRDTLVKTRNDLVKEIKAAGYNPSTLKAERERLEQELQSKREEVEAQLDKAEAILNSIPE